MILRGFIDFIIPGTQLLQNINKCYSSVSNSFRNVLLNQNTKYYLFQSLMPIISKSTNIRLNNHIGHVNKRINSINYYFAQFED